jgi:hypothetical protein
MYPFLHLKQIIGLGQSKQFSKHGRHWLSFVLKYPRSHLTHLFETESQNWQFLGQSKQDECKIKSDADPGIWQLSINEHFLFFQTKPDSHMSQVNPDEHLWQLGKQGLHPVYLLSL